MALTDPQQAEVDELKKLIGPTDYSDEQLYALIVNRGSLNAAAAQVWTEVMTSTARLIDISEGSSTRKLTDLHKQATGMATYFTNLGNGESGEVARRPRTRAIVRP